MLAKLKNLIAGSEAGKRRAFVVRSAILFFLALTTTGLLNLLLPEDALETRMVKHLLVPLRECLKIDVDVDARLKLFYFPKKSPPTIDQWQQIFGQLKTQKIAALIFTDNFYDVFSGIQSPIEQSLRDLDFTIAFNAEPSTIIEDSGKWLNTHAPDWQDFSLRKSIASEASINQDYLHVAEILPIQTANVKIVPKSVAANLQFGYVSNDFSFYPFKRVSQGFAIPHLGFYAARGKPLLAQKALTLESQNIKLIEQRFLLTNQIRAELVRNREQELTLEHISNQDISAGDVLLVTGVEALTANAVNVNTHVASVVNSVLSEQWIQPVHAETWIDVILILLTMGFCLTVGMRGQILWSGFLTLAYVCLAVITFFISAFYMPLLSAFCPVITLLFRLFIFRDSNTRSAFAASALPVVRSKPADPPEYDGAPKGRVVSILFIDVVGFSILAESQTPEEVFGRLRQIIRNIAKTVHEFGGVVDNVLGDGLLCFFGYRYDGKDTMRDHADVAIECAIEIQKQNLHTFFQGDGASPSVVYPLRMGINTASVFIGDLGGTGQAKPTIIGHGVNYAKRLEEACEGFRIMVGPATRDLLTRENKLPASIKKRPIQIKHHGQLFEAFEIDPFENEATLRENALTMYRKCVGIERKDVRILLPENVKIIFRTANGEGQVVNFSYSGFAVHMSSYLAKDVNMSISLDTPDARLGEILKTSGLNIIVAEVKWGKPMIDGYLHGFLIKNMSAEQKEKLIRIIRDYCRLKTLKINKSA